MGVNFERSYHSEDENKKRTMVSSENVIEIAAGNSMNAAQLKKGK